MWACEQGTPVWYRRPEFRGWQIAAALDAGKLPEEGARRRVTRQVCLQRQCIESVCVSCIIVRYVRLQFKGNVRLYSCKVFFKSIEDRPLKPPLCQRVECLDVTRVAYVRV